jgi:hypothetical protein
MWLEHRVLFCKRFAVETLLLEKSVDVSALLEFI